MRVALLPAGFAPQLVFISARCGSWLCPTPGLRCASGGSWFCPTTGLHYASNGSWICPETGLHFVPATAAGFAPPLVFISASCGSWLCPTAGLHLSRPSLITDSLQEMHNEMQTRNEFPRCLMDVSEVIQIE